MVETETTRRVAALALNLPPEAAVWADSSWPVERDLLATIAQEVNALRRQTIAFHARPSDVPPPLVIRRPWEPEHDRPIGLDIEAIKQFFAAG